LKRSADPDGGEEWQTSHFSSVCFANNHSPDAQVSGVCQDIEVDHVGPLNDWIHAAEGTDRCLAFSVVSAAVDQG